MRIKAIVIAGCLFFLLVNTSQLWDNNLGIYSFLSFFVLLLYWLILAIFLFSALLTIIYEKAKRIKYFQLCIFLIIILASTAIFPSGMINFGSLAKNSLLIAWREGAANCKTTLYLYEDSSFVESVVCFEISRTRGEYTIVNDTIFFHPIEMARDQDNFFKFAIIKDGDDPVSSLGDITRFENETDSIGKTLWIRKNELNE